MATVACEKEITALLVVDPYNDFISEGAICQYLSNSSPAGRANDNVKPGRQARPGAPRARYAPDRHGITAENGTGDLRPGLSLSPPVPIRSGVGER